MSVRLVSFIVPAHNEEVCIVETLGAINASARALGLDYELLVVSDSSSDHTDELAEQSGARVLAVDFRQIAATRDAGARNARGQWLVFVDADTRITTTVLKAALAALEAGASGGGSLFSFDGKLPMVVLVIQRLLQLFSRLAGFTGGCFLFCAAEAYRGCGGFDLGLYAGEELYFAVALRKVGRFVVVPHCVTTSGRKLRAYSLREIAWGAYHLLKLGPGALRSRQGLDIWYRRREDPGSPNHRA